MLEPSGSLSTAARPSLALTLESRRVESIRDVLAVMDVIDAALPDEDGVKWFNKLYAMVTQAIQREVAAGRFKVAPWIEQLDVSFAKLYFDAVIAYDKDPATCARAWQPLFDARRSPAVSRLQFALAGMNAHINHDLAIAVVETCEITSTEPARGTPYYSDYLEVNEVLEVAEKRAIDEIATGLLRDVEKALGRIDNIVAMWSIKHARDTAWTNAEVLWSLRGNRFLYGAFAQTMDRMTGFAGRGLLLPAHLGEEIRL